jgi:CMP-N,N'-diacetyllegionaminic acid synthase
MNKNTDYKTFCFDIDGVIMSLAPENDYTMATPIESTVRLINDLYKKGHRIILFTARGYVTKLNWEELTKQQLNDAGLKYHELMFGKPAADFYIDDRMIDIASLRERYFTDRNSY